MYHLIDTDSSTFTDENWQAYYELLVSLQKRYGSQLTSTIWEDLRDQQRRFQADNPGHRRVVVFDGPRAIAWLAVDVRHPGTENMSAFVLLDALFDKIPDAIARPAADAVVIWLRRFACDDAHMMTVDPRLTAVARRWQAEELGKLNQWVLHRDKAEFERIRTWLEESAAQNHTMRLEVFREIPEYHVEAYAELLTNCLQSMPEERRSNRRFHVTPEDVRQRNERSLAGPTVLHSAIVFDSNGHMAALTFSQANRKAPEEVLQFMTGVRKEYRGRGLAKWVKAALFFRLGEEFPENRRLVTWMRGVNEPMQHINTQMGYVVEREGFEFVVTRRQLEDYRGG